MLFAGNAGLMAAIYGIRPLIAGLAVAMFFLGIVTAGHMLWHYRRGTLDKADYGWRKDVRFLLPMFALAHAGAVGWYMVAH
jgi:disulfide bond formation protein DsbB